MTVSPSTERVLPVLMYRMRSPAHLDVGDGNVPPIELLGRLGRYSQGLGNEAGGEDANQKADGYEHKRRHRSSKSVSRAGRKAGRAHGRVNSGVTEYAGAAELSHSCLKCFESFKPCAW
jgi:hypothetical protein